MELANLRSFRKSVFILICLWLVGVVVATNYIQVRLQANSPPDLPFGVFHFGGGMYAQDFSYNLLYFKGIQEQIVSHPYTLQDQEALMRHLLPGLSSGMSHAYSPVAFVLAQPLLWVSGHAAYLIYILLSAAATLLLYRFYLLPRVNHPLQLRALTLCAISLWVVTTFVVGQSALITTAFLGAFWCLLSQRKASGPVLHDILIATLFWALCLKPSIAILPIMLLLGSQAWRPLLIGGGLLLMTWLSVANYYGGWWTGFWEYLHLLNHYNNADFSPYMQRGNVTAQNFPLITMEFSLNRYLLLSLSAALLFLKWTRRITASEHFQGMIWAFLLFSPYLLPSENWILCLLVVEGTFFHSRDFFPMVGKLLLVAAIFDLRAGITVPHQVDYPLKCLLFIWVLAELILARQKAGYEAEDFEWSASATA